jgi:hypothetical protein
VGGGIINFLYQLSLSFVILFLGLAQFTCHTVLHNLGERRLLPKIGKQPNKTGLDDWRTRVTVSRARKLPPLMKPDEAFLSRDSLHRSEMKLVQSLLDRLASYPPLRGCESQLSAF